MTKPLVCTCTFVVAISLAGCRSTATPEYPGEVRVTSPQLVKLTPQVSVVADADEPLFFAQGNYWLYRDGYWFHAPSYRANFALADRNAVPPEILGIDRPELYVQYRLHVAQIEAAKTRKPAQTAYGAPLPERGYHPPAQQQQPDPAKPDNVSKSSTYPNQPHAPGAQPESPDPTQPTSPESSSQPTKSPLPTETGDREPLPSPLKNQ